jgi:WD40 repeat protein
MAIHVTCRCGKEFWVADSWGGKQARCPACGQDLAIPDPSAADLVVAEEAAAPAVVDEGGGYALTEESARLPDRLPGQGGGDLRLGGEIGVYRLAERDGTVSCVAFSPDGARALAGLGSDVFVLNLQTGKKAYRFREHEDPVLCAAVSPDGRLALSGDEEGALVLWELAGGRPLRWLEGHRGAVARVAFAAHGHYALSGGADGTARLWEAASGREAARYREGAGVTAAAVSPDGRLVLTGAEHGGLSLWRVQTGRRERELNGEGLGKITCAAFSKDGERVLAAGRGGFSKGTAVAHWDLRHDRRLPCFEGKRTGTLPGVHHAAFSADGEYVFGGGDAETQDVNEQEWNAADTSRTTQGHRLGGEAVVLGPLLGAKGVKASIRCTLTSTPVGLWRLESGYRLKSFIGHKRRRGPATVTCAAVSADGRRGLSGGNDARVELWGLM